MRKLIRTSKNHYKFVDQEKPPDTDGQEPVRVHGKLSRSLSEFVRASVQDGLWLFRTASDSEKKRSKRLYTAIASGVVVAVTALLLSSGAEAKTQVMIIAMATALLITLDPFEIFQRWVASQTRIVILSDTIIVDLIIFLGLPPREMLLPILLWIAGSGFVCYHMNTRWRLANNWRYTKFITKTMRGQARMSEKAWQGHGKRESRTLLYELGYNNVTDDVLDFCIKPVYILGHVHGLNKIGDDEDDEYKDEYDEEEYDEYENEDDEDDEEYDEEEQELQMAYNELSGLYNALSENYNALRDEFMNLQQEAQEEPVQPEEPESESEERPVPEEPEPEIQPVPEEPEPEMQPQEELQRAVKELRERNDKISIRAMATELGVPKNRIEKALKALKEEQP